MKKNKEWLKEQIKDEEVELKYAFDNYEPYENVLIAEYVNDLLDQLEEPEQEKGTIPQFVADWIEHQKKGDLYSCLSSLTNYLKVHEWFYDNYEKNGFKSIFDLVAKIWLDGYSVEKEKLYYVALPYIGYMTNDKDQPFVDYKEDATKSTEQEIKAIDERFWAFAEEVPD